MEEEIQFPMASLHKNRSSFSKVRFLGVLKQPDSGSDSNPFELEESDVIWSSDNFIEQNSPVFMPTTVVSNSPTNNHRQQSFRMAKFGLSAALSDDQHSFVQRKPSLNPSLSAATTARIIPPVSIIPRSSSNDFSGTSPVKFHQSAPLSVPVWPKGNPARLEFFDEDDENMEEEMLPPHEIVARSRATTFSVFEGMGRTLKGRDLRRVRNAVWQKTGFLD